MDDKDQKGFIVYGDTKAVIDELTDEQAGRLFRGMLEYFVNGNEPEFSDVLKFVFIPIRQQMDRNANKYEKRCERNKENAKKRWDNANACNRMQSDANACDRMRNMRTHAIDANTDTGTDNKKEKGTGTGTESHQSDNDVPLSLLSYLNQKTGSSYPASEGTMQLIEEKLSEGYTVEQMRSVIDKKFAEWSCDGKMRSYLRPSTLFGDRFEEYLNAPLPAEVEEERKSSERVASLKKQLREKERDHDGIEKRLADIVQSGRYLSDLHDEYEELKLKSAILEQEIDNLKVRTGKNE